MLIIEESTGSGNLEHVSKPLARIWKQVRRDYHIYRFGSTNLIPASTAEAA